jgi:hypothetical protein
MKIEKALAIVQAKGRRIPLKPGGHLPAGATLWNVPEGHIVQEAVYFAYSGGLVKIGYSIAPAYRRAELAAASAHPVVMVLIVPGSEADERKFHARFADDRAHHEWFRVSKRMRDFFKARLCKIGRESFKRAESEFIANCKEVAGQ